MSVLSYSNSLLPLLVVCAVTALLGFPLAERRDELYEMRRRTVKAKKELDHLKAERDRLLDERRRLLTKASAIERVAREQYGFVAPGEYPVDIDTEIEKDAPKTSVDIPSDGWDWLLGRGGYPWRLPLVVLFAGAVVLGILEFIRQISRATSAS